MKKIIDTFNHFSIQWKLISIVVLVYVGVMSFFIFDISQNQKKFLIQENMQETTNVAMMLSKNSTSWILANDFIGLEEIILSIATYPDLEYAMILDTDGKVLAHNNQQFVNQYISDVISKQILKAKEPIVLQKNHYIIDVAVPIYYQSKIIGWSRVALNNESIDANSAYITKHGILYTLFAIIVGVFCAYFLGSSIIHNIFKIIDFTREITNGRWDRRLTFDHKDEIGILASHINAMLDELQLKEHKIIEMNGILQASEFRWKFAIEGNKDGLWDWNLANNIVYFSPQWKKMLGFEDSEIEATLQEWEKRVHPDDLQKTYDDLQRYLEGKCETYSNEHRVLCKDGSYKWVLDRGVIVERDEDGKPQRLIGTHKDIDEQKQLMYKLEQSYAKFASLYDNALNAILLLNFETGKFEDVNPKACSLYGYSKDEFTHLSPKSLDAIYDDGDIYAVQKNIIARGWERFETKHKLKSGEIIDVFISSVAIRLDSKQYLYVTVRDLREEKEQKEIFETIFKSAKDGLMLMDTDTHFLKVNQSSSLITGLSVEELLHTSCLALTIEEDKDKTNKIVEQVLAGEQVENFEKICVINNRRISVDISLTLMPNKRNILASIRDISNKKIYEEQAKLASMGEMIGNIAHQWRQPLSVISTIASGTKIKHEYGMLNVDELLSEMDEIMRQTKYLSKTIDDFRNFSKQSNQQEFISVVETVQKTLSIVQSALKNNNISVITNLECDAKILGYENELIQSFINIINNARDALKENLGEQEERFICITTSCKEKNLSLEIKDNGGGIAENVLPRIFEPYFTTKHQSVGTGIGLSMTYKMITERHRANITVRNVHFKCNGIECKGASFDIEFAVE